MSVLLSDKVDELQREATVVCFEYARAKQAFAEAAAKRESVLAMMRQILLDGIDELSRDSLECAVKTMVAIHKGEEDDAYQLARACARAACASSDIFDEVFGRVKP